MTVVKSSKGQRQRERERVVTDGVRTKETTTGRQIRRKSEGEPCEYLYMCSMLHIHDGSLAMHRTN